MLKQALIVVLMCGFATRLSSSGKPKEKDAILELNDFLISKGITRTHKFEKILNHVKSLIKSPQKGLREDTIELARNVSSLIEHGLIEPNSCDDQFLDGLQQVLDVSISHYYSYGMPPRCLLEKLFDKYIETHNCVAALQQRWDQLKAESAFSEKYKQLIGRLDKKISRYFSNKYFVNEAEGVREFYASMAMDSAIREQEMKKMMLLDLSLRKTFGSLLWPTGSMCEKLVEEKASQRVLRPLFIYDEKNLSDASPSMLKWAARFAACRALLVKIDFNRRRIIPPYRMEAVHDF